MSDYRWRNRLRYPEYDYAQPAAIFVTLCTYARQPLFGTVTAGRMEPSPAGEMALTCWNRIPHTYPAIGIDAVVVMPDHVHGILLTAADALVFAQVGRIQAYRR